MQLTADEIIQKYRKQCRHFNRNTLLPYENDYICFPSGFNLIKRKHELCRLQQKKINFINRLKHADQKIICICIAVFKIYEGNDFDKIYEVVSTLKNKKLKTNNILIKKFKDLLEILILNKIIGQKQLKIFIKLDMIVFD